MGNPKYRAFAAISPGLEMPLLSELKQLGIRGARQPGGVGMEVGAEDLYAVNLFSRLAGRVTVEVCRTKANSLKAIHNGVKAAPWKRYVWPGQPVEVRATVIRAKLPGRNAVANKVTLAITDALRGPRLPGPRAPRQPAKVHILVEGDTARVTVDSSGELLHKRGWRQATAKAPIRENYAAAILRLAEWGPGEPLLDPMCGSGTFCIEAATIALGRAPGADRPFAFERWPTFDKSLMATLRREAREMDPLDEDSVFICGDRDAGAVKATMANAKRAGVLGALSIDSVSFGMRVPPTDSGLLVCNPPYGERVDGGHTDWSAFARILRDKWKGWRVAVVVPPSAKRSMAFLELEEVASFQTGGIPVRVLVGEVG
ncbi:MAG: putative N6-adenine-specific DNA methylase [Myxococcota bacterium]|jgi:putative N6-adenine-specific DNA methylase